MTGEAILKTKSVCLFSACPEFVAVSGWLQPKLWKGPQLQAVVYRTDHCNYSRARQPSKQLQWTLRGVCVCVCLYCYIVCLVMDSCQWKERAVRGAGWISVFALARRQKTPLFFSAGDNKWIGERATERERVRLTKKRNRK